MKEGSSLPGLCLGEGFCLSSVDLNVQGSWLDCMFECDKADGRISAMPRESLLVR